MCKTPSGSGRGGNRSACKNGSWIFETINVTSGPRIEQRIAETRADVLFIQEHHWKIDKIGESRQKYLNQGWSSEFGAASQSEVSETGTIGGTAILTTKGVGLADLVGVDESVARLPEHRATLQIVNAVLPEGVVSGSVYTQTGIGYTGTNIVLLDQLGERLKAYGRPFILGGDFNMSKVHLQNSGWLAALDAQIVSPPEGQHTCFDHTGKGADIDYFVVSRVLCSAVSCCWVDQRPTAIRTHKPVCLRIRGIDKNRLVLRLWRPARLPSHSDATVVEAEAPDYSVVTDALGELANKAGEDQQEGIDNISMQWGKLMETELLAKLGIQGEEASKHKGLIAPPRMLWKQILGKHSARPLACRKACLFHFVSDRLRQISYLTFGAQAEPPSEQALETRQPRINGLWGRLGRLKWDIKEEPPQIWWWWRSLSARGPELSKTQLQVAMQIFAAEAVHLEKRATAERAKAWRTWATTTAMQNGARLAHQYSRPLPPWIPMTLDDSGKVPEPQQLAETQAGPWHKLWRVGEESFPTDMRDAALQLELPAPTPAELRNTAKTFSRYTAIGGDNVHPWHIGILSDPCLEALGAFFFYGLNPGIVAQVLGTILMALIPKDTGGTRGIGIFTSIMRIMMRWLRMTIIGPWEMNFKRDFWFGQSGRCV